MDSAQILRPLFGAGAQPSLIEAFRALADQTTFDGGLQYTFDTLRKLALTIAHRKYAGRTVGGRRVGGPIYELCHLVNAADAMGRSRGGGRGRGGGRSRGGGRGGYLEFFFSVQPATAGAFRGHVDTSLQASGWRRPGFETIPGGITISYDDGTFDIRYGRMPLLAAFLNLLMTAVAPEEISTVLDEMLESLAGTSSVAASNEAAGRLAGILYHHLEDELETATAAGKAREIHGFLAASAAEDAVSVDDQVILDFWVAHLDGEVTGSFREFRTVADSFVDFLRARRLAATVTAADRGEPLGTDADAGEWDVNDPALALDDDEIWSGESPMFHAEVAERLRGVRGHATPAEGEWESPLSALAEPPAGDIKFLYEGSDQPLVRRLLDYGPIASDLPMTLLRAEVFGGIQSEISNAIRTKRMADVPSLIALDAAETYRDREAALGGLRSKIDENLQAARYVLLRRAALAPTNVVAFPGAAGRPEVEPEQSENDELEEALEAAHKVFRRIKRKGFEDALVDDPERIEGFRIGADVLLRIDAQLGTYIRTLRSIDGGDRGLGDWYAHDGTVFSGRFEQIYGAEQ